MYILDEFSLPSTRFCSVVFLEIRRKAKLCYSALNTGNKFFAGNLAPVVQKVDNAIHQINHYPLDIAIGFAITYPVDSDLSGG